MTSPTPDAQSPKFPSPYPHPTATNHSNPPGFVVSPVSSSASSSVSHPETDPARSASDVHTSLSADFSHSWDLATGGLKTLTAKRELPPRQVRPQAVPPPALTPTRSYMFLLVILACIIVMLISGGVVLFMTLQP